jgi:hypothetical protein
MRPQSQYAMGFTQSRFVRPAQSTRSLSSIFIGGFLFALGILSSVVVHLIGDIFVAEILIIVALPLLLAHSAQRLAIPRLKRLFALLGAWLFAQILSDAYNHTVLADRLRGMALIGFFAIEIAFFAICLGTNEQRKAIYLTAYALGSLALTRFQPNVAAIEVQSTADWWKWSYAFGATILAALISSFLLSKRREVLAILLLLVVSAVDLLMNFRSAFLMLLVTIVLVFPIIPEQIGRFRLLPRKKNLFRFAIVAILAITGGWSANQLLHLVTRSGLIGEEAQQKNESQAQAGNLLLGGRPEVFIGLQAAMDSPILGHGSWARDMKYLEMQHDMLQEYGIEHDLKDSEANTHGLIPTHSHIVGAWAFAGFLGVLFWVYLFWLVVRAIVVAVVHPPALAPVYVWLLVGYTWNILFSPFGSTSRIIEAFTIVVIVDLLDQIPTRTAHQRKIGDAGWRRNTSFRRVTVPGVFR